MSTVGSLWVANNYTKKVGKLNPLYLFDFYDSLERLFDFSTLDFADPSSYTCETTKIVIWKEEMY